MLFTQDMKDLIEAFEKTNWHRRSSS